MTEVLRKGIVTNGDIGLVNSGQVSTVEIGIVTPNSGATFSNKQTICLSFNS